MTKNIIECDLAVIGAGGSGLVAAVKAAEDSGKNIVVVEKAKKPGGCAYFAHTFQIENSKWHKEKGLSDTGDKTFRMTMKNLNWNVNPKIVQNYVNAAGTFFDWLVEKGGAEEYFTKPLENRQDEEDYGNPGGPGSGKKMLGVNFPKRHINKNSPDPSIGPGWMGSYVVTKMLEQCEKMKIRILTETRAKQFITDRKGNVTGILADSGGGKVQINCKACIIAAGGFGANREKLQKRWPEIFNGDRMHIFSVPTDEGDSLDMAEKIGAYIDYRNMYWQVGGPVHHPYSYSIFRLSIQPEVIFVNLNGERFMDETDAMTGGVYAVTRQPQSVAYAVVDHEIVEMLGKGLIEDPPNESDIPVLERFREDIAYEAALDDGGAKGNHTKKADTLEGLAEKMGVDPNRLVATIKKYNEYCDKGRDLDFAKKSETLKHILKPPFYAFFMQRFAECTHGGIVINENMEVLNSSGKVMQGLFAAGDNTGGMTIDGPGLGELTWAVRSGFLAGTAAAKYIKRA